MQKAGGNIKGEIDTEYNRGNYRFVADICHQLLLGKAEEKDVNTYCSYLAGSLRQLGYMAESGI